MKHALIATFLLVVAVGTAQAQDSVQIKTNVEYAVHDGVSLRGDLYLPMSVGPHPAMLLIHGGGFARGSKSAYGVTWGPYLAARGYVVFAIDYRLSTPTQSTWPQALLDCKAGLQYLRGNAPSLGIDPARIGVGGDSAGASLTALLAVTQDLPQFQHKYPNDPYASASTKTKAAVAIYGVYDMMAQERYASRLTNPGKEMEQFLGGTSSQVPTAYLESSSLNYIRESSSSAPLRTVGAQNPATQAAWFLAWGAMDPVVPPNRQSVVFVEALKEAAATVTSIAVPNVDHYWFPFTELTGKKGEPACEEPKPAKFSCSGATPNDFIASQLLEFLSHNL